MKKLIWMLFAAFSFFACSEDDDKSIALDGMDEIKLSTNLLTIGPDGGTVDVTVESSGEWHLSGYVDWITPEVMSGKNGEKLSFRVSAGVAEEREAVYKVFTGTAVQQLQIRQELSYLLELESDSELSLSSERNTVLITLNTNIPNLELNIPESASWITLKNIYNGFGKKYVELNISANDSYVSRESEVIVLGQGKEVKVKIFQSQQDAILIDTETPIVLNSLDSQDIEIKLRTNVEYALEFLDSWIHEKEVQKGEIMDGLQAQTVILSVDNATVSRDTRVSFKYGSIDKSIVISQKNPNAVFGNFPKRDFRDALINAGWIKQVEGDYCEILEKGLTLTELELDDYSISGIDGIKNFPQLESIKLSENFIQVCDLSALTKVHTLELSSNYLKEVRLSNNPITSFKLNSGSYESGQFIISGENLTSFDWTLKQYAASMFQELDVTGCPQLQDLNITGRADNMYGTLKTIYMTSEQQSKVQITGQDQAQIIVK